MTAIAVIDQGVDAAEPLQRRADDPAGGLQRPAHPGDDQRFTPRRD
jgi:hypothetical protein